MVAFYTCGQMPTYFGHIYIFL